LLERAARSTLLRSERVGLFEEAGAFSLVADRRRRSGGLFAHDCDEARVPDLASDHERPVQLSRRGIDGALVEFRRSDAGAGTRLTSGDVCRKADCERPAVMPPGSRRINAPPRGGTASEQSESKQRLAANVSGNLVGQPEDRVGLVRSPAIESRLAQLHVRPGEVVREPGSPAEVDCERKDLLSRIRPSSQPKTVAEVQAHRRATPVIVELVEGRRGSVAERQRVIDRAMVKSDLHFDEISECRPPRVVVRVEHSAGPLDLQEMGPHVLVGDALNREE
jgi:hypothetical protein